MLCHLFVFALSFIGCKLQANCNPVYYQTLPPGYRAPFVQSYRPYWASYYTAVPLVSRQPTPNVAYAFNYINTRNTCLTNDVKAPEASENKTITQEHTTAPTTASCPSPNQLPCVAAGMRDPMHVAPMLLQLFNPYVYNLMEKMSEMERPRPTPVEATTAGCTEDEATEGGIDIVAVTTETSDPVTESCTNEAEGLSAEDAQTAATEISEMTECVQIQTDSQQTTCIPVEDEPQDEAQPQLTPDSTDEQAQTTAAALPAINTEDIKTNLVEGA